MRLIIPLLALILLAGCKGKQEQAEPSIPFDRKVWMAQQDFEIDASPRWLMYDDLMAKHLPLGMTRAQAIKLLGEPSVRVDPSTVLEEAGPVGSRIHSTIGYPLVENKVDVKHQISGMTICLVLAFDANGRLCWKGTMAQ